jgi:hypothetical protein
MPRRRTKQHRQPIDGALNGRVEDLDRRVTQLEARLRVALPLVRAEQARAEAKAGKRPPRARPRCPGCTLELPKGKKGEACVWCGFRFDAVKGLLR